MPARIAAALLLRRRGLLRLVGGLAAQLGAGALGDVLPLVGGVVGLGLAGARMGASEVGAVVLAGLGDAVALLLRGGLVVGGLSAGQQAHGENGSEGGRGDEALVHGFTPGVVVMERCG